ncbi:hypothetical protein SH668x_000316 [Planctomicrobium sp. SH668]|uniref:hypothetical protein n=1 Tax=Planctomicrobium sp. SH668 TaxID=3448126 RepID=UPI003F5BF6F8
MKLKVPRQDGDHLAGASRDGVNISLEGQIGSHAGELKVAESSMLECVDLLREALRSTDERGFFLGMFRDEEGIYRYFQRCFTNSFDVDFSNPRIYSYSVVIHAGDPVLYEGIPVTI